MQQKKNILISGGVSLILFILCILIIQLKTHPDSSDKELKILVFADTHYLSTDLFDLQSPDFKQYKTSSWRLAEAGAMLWNQSMTTIMQYPEDILLICGNLSNNGELQSHREFAEKLQQLRQNGKRIFVIPGRDDIQNENAKSYKNDTVKQVETLSKEDFRKLYSAFGYDQAITSDTASLSYIAALNDKYWLFAIDATLYSEVGNVIEYRKIDRRTIDWLNTQFEIARKKKVRVLVMQHYHMFEHFTGEGTTFKTSLLDRPNSMANYFADKGVKVAFTGHSHANDITFFESLNRNKLYDVSTSSYVAPPFAFRRVNIKDDRMQLATESLLDNEEMKATKARWDADFEALLTESYKQILTTAPYSFNETLSNLIAPTLANAMIAHYKGDEVQNSNVEATVRMLKILNLSYDMNFIYSLYKDLPPADNQLIIDLSDK